MNPPNPFLNPSFTFLPPNPNPDFSYSHPQISQPHLPSSLTSDTITLSPNPDLHSSISILKDLIDLAENTVKSISDTLFSGKPPVSDDGFCSCPFDYRHRMPPEFLFRHSVTCPSSPAVIDLDLLEPLQYPRSLKSEEESRRENRFVQSLKDSDSELCFSLNDSDFGSNFFYRDCPGVVCSSEHDATKKTFTLPGVLSVECANFISKGVGTTRNFPKGYLKILPSELWAMRSELELWGGFPSAYSYTVLRVALNLQMIREVDVLKWVISNSPYYGVVIDVPMRNHIFLLLRLCLKAISREAFCSNELLLSSDSNQGNGDFNPKYLSFRCPILVEVMMWLASQLSVLYGEANGRLFSINMLKNCLLNVASSSLLFPLEPKETEATASEEVCGALNDSFSDRGFEIVESKMIGNVKLQEPGESAQCESGVSFKDENASICLVFVSQVASAIAALHERALLEKNIKGLRFAGSLSKSQMVVEHSNLSMRADEERQKRSNYRPILEHDGLLWQRSHNQGSSKTKTREELLAEERDYKRRRMSYRGKKVKRTTTQVMRDIIEEHMEEIKLAGGIGCFVKGSSDSGMFPPGSVSAHNMIADVYELKNNVCDSSHSTEPSGGQSHGYKKQSHSDYDITNSRSEDAPPNDQLSLSCGLRNSHHRQRHESRGHHEPLEDHRRSISRDKHDREYSSRSSASYRSHGQSHERHRHRRERDDVDVTSTDCEQSGRVSSRRSKHHDNSSFSSASNPASDIHDRKYDPMSETRDRHMGRTYRRYRSDSMKQDTFEDRYDPSGSYDRYEATYDDDISSSSKYAKPDKFYSTNDDNCHNEVQRIDSSSKGHQHDHH